MNPNAAVAGHAAHTMDTRMAAAEFGVPMDTMRGMQHAAASAANSAAMGSAPMDTSGGDRDLGAAPGAVPMDTSGSAAPPPAAPASSSAQFDYLGRLNTIEQSKRQNAEIHRPDMRAFNESLRQRVVQASTEAAAAAARRETAQMHREAMQPFQDLTQQ